MSPALVEFAELAPLGIVVGLYGTLIGAGGGFVLVPVLLLIMPGVDAATITSTSLAVVFFNSYSGSMVYMRMRRIDYFAATLLVLAGLPGAVFGSMLAHRIPRSGFEPAFGLMLVIAGLWMAWKPLGGMLATAQRPQAAEDNVEALPRDSSFNTLVASLGGAYIGLLSSLLGIGGGIIQVPFLVRVLRFPPHVATATSQLVLAILSLAATIAHVALGAFQTGIDRTMFLAVGVMMGAPIGAMLSSRVRGSVIVKLLALGLGLVGMRLLLGGLFAR